MTARACVIFLAIVGAASAQDRFDSHAPVPMAADGKPSDLLAKRLAQLNTDQSLGDLQALLRRNAGGIDPALLNRLRNDPAFQEVLRRLRDGDPELMRQIEELSRTNPILRDQESLRRLARQLASSDRLRDFVAPNADQQRPPLDQKDLEARRAFAERVGDFLHEFKLEGFANTLQGSDTFRDILKQVAKSGLITPTGTADMKNATDVLATLESTIKKMKQWLPASLPRFPNVHFNPPRQLVDLANTTFRPQNLPRIGDQWTTWSTALSVAGIVVLAGMIVLRSRKKMAPTFVLIPVSPPDPDAIVSRDDFVRAFEQLSLAVFGEPAEHWHHRLVANKLSQKSADEGDVEALTRLYEQARYVPAVATTDVRWESGREPLRRLIAGVA